MSEKCDEIPLGAWKIGTLITVCNKGTMRCDEITYGEPKIVAEYDQYGSVIGVRRDDIFVDIKTGIAFNILPRDEKGQPVFDNVSPNQLYVTNTIELYKLLSRKSILDKYGIRNLDGKLKEPIKRTTLRKIMKILKGEETLSSHITDETRLPLLQERFPKTFPKQTNKRLEAWHKLRANATYVADLLFGSTEISYPHDKKKKEDDKSYQIRIGGPNKF